MKPSRARVGVAAGLKPLLTGKPGWTLAVAESLTAGHVQAQVSAISGASNYFLGGITAYSLDQKVKQLGVDRASARRVNSVSGDVAEQMARGVCRLFGSDFGLGTTGYAERSADDDVLEPFAWWALSRRQARGRFTFRRGRIECTGCSRVETQQIVAEAVLTELVGWLRECRGD